MQHRVDCAGQEAGYRNKIKHPVDFQNKKLYVDNRSYFTVLHKQNGITHIQWNPGVIPVLVHGFNVNEDVTHQREQTSELHVA